LAMNALKFQDTLQLIVVMADIQELS
jgi:hypothetical protein